MIALPCLLLFAAQLETEVTARAGAPTVAPAAAEDPTARLAAEPDAGLAQSGGPLAPVRLEVRGLSGPRAGLRVDGLSLADPASGDIDAAFAPLYLAPRAARSGSGLALAVPAPVTSGAAARVAFGSLASARADLRADVTADGGEATLAGQFARTAGDFVFTPRTPDGRLSPAQVRTNNDQTRAGLFAAGRARFGRAEVGATALGTFHDGGVPGFAAAPTDGLRGQRALLGVRPHLSGRAGPVDIAFAPTARLSTRRAVTRTGAAEAVAAVHTGVSARAGVVSAGLDAALTLGAERTAVLATGFARQAVFAKAAATGRAGPFVLSAQARGDWLSDQGLLVGGQATAALRLGPADLRLGLAHRPRAPTLDELFAPRGLVLGNPDLVPEALTDVDAALVLRLPRATVVEVAPFGGIIWDAILFTNRNAYEIAPINTGPGWRAGVSGRVRSRPARWVTLDVSGRLLHSQVFASGAPLPLAAPVQGRGRLALGPPTATRVLVTARHRGPTASNLFGTLKTPAYTLFDLGLSHPLGPGVAVSVSAQNVFNRTDAADMYLFPLPGRVVFVGLEVAS